MFKSNSKKTQIAVSTAIIMTVLTLMLTGCTSNTSVNNKNNEEIKNVNNQDEEIVDNNINDGEYELYLTLTGGSGRATVTSPTKASIYNGEITLTVEWSSPNYDYMIVGKKKYLPVNEEGNSVFEIPIDSMNGEVFVTADTVAMGTPHTIDYTISFSTKDNEDKVEEKTSSKEVINTKVQADDIDKWKNNHKVTGKLEREYAERFKVSFYDDRYCMIVINESDYYMLDGDGYSIPSDMPEGITVINVPLKDIDLVSKSTLDYFDCLEALDCVAFSSINSHESENANISDLMDRGKIKYAGKYSAPDYELLLSGGCSLVVENTMITHTKDVLDQLHNIGISTLIDYSSYEPSPIGRMEWIKLYGLLTGKSEKANMIFKDKAVSLSKGYENTGKKIAYFYISENGGIGIRKNQDYIVKLINIAGGEYAFSDMDEYDGTGQMTIQREAFYKEILDCDVLIYNSTINGGLTSKEELVSKCEVLKNTVAYKNDAIFCTSDNLYLSVMRLPEIADELNELLCGKETEGFFYKLK